MTIKRFISDRDARMLNLTAAFTEHDLTAPFDRERSQVRFAARTPSNVYNVVKMENEALETEMSDDNKQKRTKIAKTMLTPDQMKALEQSQAIGESVSDFVYLAIQHEIEARRVNFPDNAIGQGVRTDLK